MKRPLFIALLLGCTASFLTCATLDLRLVASAMVYWGLIRLFQIIAVVAVCARDRRDVSLSRMIDSFFAGHLPWSIWLIGACAVGAFLSPATQAFDSNLSFVWLDVGAVVAVIWSAFLDFRFFRLVMKRTPRRARIDLFRQRVISWGLGIAVIGAPTAWSEIVGWLRP